MSKLTKHAEKSFLSKDIFLKHALMLHRPFYFIGVGIFITVNAVTVTDKGVLSSKVLSEFGVQVNP